MTTTLHPVWRPIWTRPAVALLLLSVAIPPLVADAAESPPKASQEGELQIEGNDIQSLTLFDTAGEQRTLTRPEATVSLPVDQYRIVEIRLESGPVCSYPTTAETLSVTKDRPCKLQAGGPLVSGVTFERSGKILTLDYGLVDAAGRKYRGGGASSDAPRFVVYQGDREIGSGTFEYG